MLEEKSHKVDFTDEVTGLIHGFVFKEHQTPRRITSGQIQAEYQQQKDTPGFLWLHINLNHAASEKWLRKQFDIEEFFFEEIRNGSHSTRIESQHNVLFAVLNDANFKEDGSGEETATLWLYCCTGLVITARHKPLRLIERLFHKLETLAPTSPTSLLVHLLEEQEDVLEHIVRQANQYVDQIEERLLSGLVKKNRTRLGRMRRQLLRFQRLLAPEPAALFRLMNRPPRWLSAEVVRDLRQFAEEFTVVLNDLVGLTERIRLLQEEISSSQMEQNNRSLYVLTVITVLALPINIVAGFFGMNVGGIPLASNPHGFVLLVLVVALFTVIAGWFALRKRDDD
ncbi:transporter [Rouxiella badensis]|jgi:zinc transporter|uniref:Magnesium transporter CorA n=1 Tax=Rouxiella badensis TaxID=1646377 RepID=A0A1X0W9N1_9GAMM|nr:transporter [Rouxiella badensis]MCC3704230.1 transporter [Rouxiella badensis]MCC3719681.1 transporter [Rouxiella badensis]MCC3728931.1 transporter [Rouxiella badensis]MCC3733358.1 transporter [Rouxiella badensis]MCC3740873.1 transporter [Rouxiella badensis]